MTADKYVAPPPSGWLGLEMQLLHYLHVVGAQRDAEGKFLIGSAPVVSFMGEQGDGAEVLVPAETWCVINGHQVPIAPGLNSTSYRMPVVVYGMETQED